MTTSTRVGRPRDATVSFAVAGGVISLLREVGLSGLTMDAVASRAGVSKASIYRRWASKEELLVDVIANLASENPIPDTGHFRDDLVELLHRMEAFLSEIEAGQIFPRMAAEVHAATELGRRYAERVILPRRAMLAGMLSGAQARGELRDDLHIDVAVDMLTGPVILRMLLGGLVPYDADWSPRLVDGLLQGWAGGASASSTRI
ncbi:MAG TPA: TetR/AcrR family transcriptional regulator [Acidimicrobiia bacterium]|nr:TetR/AcrR family transcriptional regulator [Acidimicrobiia bacterium]